MSRLTIEVTEQQHQSLKAMAAIQGKTIKEYAIERLFPANSNEDQAMSELRVLLQERIAQSNRGEIVDRSITEIASTIIQSGKRG